MKIGILGTGMVGQTLGGKLAELGHDVMIGTRDVAQHAGAHGAEPVWQPAFSAWHAEHSGCSAGHVCRGRSGTGKW